MKKALRVNLLTFALVLVTISAFTIGAYAADDKGDTQTQESTSLSESAEKEETKSDEGSSKGIGLLAAGLATGLKKDFAVKFSMLLSIPVLFASNIRCFADALREGIDWHCVPAYLVGMAAAIAAAVSSITVLRSIAKRGKFGGFAYYCWVLGVLSIILSMIF